MGLPAETLHEVNALGERLPQKRVVLKLHEHIVHLAGAGIPPPLERLDQFRVHSEPAHPFHAIPRLVVGQPDFFLLKVHITPRQPEDFASATSREVQGQQHDQVLPFRLLEHLDDITFRWNVALTVLYGKWLHLQKWWCHLWESLKEVGTPVPCSQQILAVLVGDVRPALILDSGKKLIGSCRSDFRDVMDALFAAVGEKVLRHQLLFHIGLSAHGSLNMGKVTISPRHKQF